MRIAVRIALVGLGLLATGMNVLGQTADTPQTTPQNQQKNQNTDEITAVPNRPTFASTAEMAHLVQFLVSKDFGKHHFDVNEGVQFVGRAQLSGFDRRYFTALSYSRPLKGKWGYTGEIAGFSRRNARTPATMTLLNAATYNVSPRLG